MLRVFHHLSNFLIVCRVVDFTNLFHCVRKLFNESLFVIVLAADPNLNPNVGRHDYVNEYRALFA